MIWGKTSRPSRHPSAMITKKTKIKGGMSRGTWRPEWRSITMLHWSRSLSHVVLFFLFFLMLAGEFFGRKRESWFIVTFQDENNQSFCNSHEKKGLLSVHGSVTKWRFTRKKFAISQFTGNKKGLSRITKKPFTTLKRLPGLPLKTFSLAVDSWDVTFADTRVHTVQLSCQLNKPHLLKYRYSFTCEQRHCNHFTAIKGFLKTKTTPAIRDMYDRHPSVKPITSTTVITRRVVSIDFYRLIHTVDDVYVIYIASYQFIKWFSDIYFYRLPRPRLYTSHNCIRIANQINMEITK